MKQILTVQMELQSDAIFSSGGSVPGGEDIALRTGAGGWPVLVGATFKGLLRESVTNLLCWSGGDTAAVAELFGQEGRRVPSPRQLVFGDLTLTNPPADPDACVSERTFTAIGEDGLVQDGSLRLAVCLNGGLVFAGELICEEQDAALVADGLSGIKTAGLLRSRGFGEVKFSVEGVRPLRPAAAVQPGHWLRYRLRLLTPMAISWLSRSGSTESGQNYTETRLYLPGSAVRGMVAEHLAAADPAWFAAHKAALLGEGVRFGSALPTCGSKAGIPTPKGFYAFKDGSGFCSVLLQQLQPGQKRADPGSFCVIENGQMQGYTPAVSSSLRSRRNKTEQNGLFTVRRLCEGQLLEGWIALDDPALAPVVAKAFGERVWLGADRHAGSGLCAVELLETADAPHWNALGYQPGEAVPQTVYMLLLSPACMESGGMPVGMDEEQLAALLGVERVQLGRCATSVTETAGTNTALQCRVPALTMYEAGSVFTLHCTPAPTAEALASLQRQGLGLRRAEGCGQVLFLKNYAALRRAEAAPAAAHSDTAADRVRRARCRWLLQQKPPQGVSRSQLGVVQALCEQAMVQRLETAALEEHFRHNMEERGVRQGAAFRALWKQLQPILRCPLGETLRCAEAQDSLAERLRLACDWMDLSRKGDAGQ